MQKKNTKPNHFTLTNALSTCANLVNLEHGKGVLFCDHLPRGFTNTSANYASIKSLRLLAAKRNIMNAPSISSTCSSPPKPKPLVLCVHFSLNLMKKSSGKELLHQGMDPLCVISTKGEHVRNNR